MVLLCLFLYATSGGTHARCTVVDLTGSVVEDAAGGPVRLDINPVAWTNRCSWY